MSNLERVDVYINQYYEDYSLETITNLSGDYLRVEDLRNWLSEYLREGKTETLYSDLLKQLN